VHDVPSAEFRHVNIIIADEDPACVEFVILALREDGYAAFHAYDGLSAIELALGFKKVDLVITDTRVAGTPGLELIRMLRHRRPNLPMIYIANIGRSTPELEAQLPLDVPILREPFSADELRSTVRKALPTVRRRTPRPLDRPSPDTIS